MIQLLDVFSVLANAGVGYALNELNYKKSVQDRRRQNMSDIKYEKNRRSEEIGRTIGENFKESQMRLAASGGRSPTMATTYKSRWEEAANQLSYEADLQNYDTFLEGLQEDSGRKGIRKVMESVKQGRAKEREYIARGGKINNAENLWIRNAKLPGEW